MTTQTVAPPRRAATANITSATANIAAARAVAVAQTPDAVAARQKMTIRLGQDAVRYARNGDWERARDANCAILRQQPDDCEAANRLAKALMELGDLAHARPVLLTLCQRFPGNAIARKNLARLQKLESSSSSSSAASAAAAVAITPRPPATGRADFPGNFPAGSFIEEGGKSCSTTLRRYPETTALAPVDAGAALTLHPEPSGVSVATAAGQRLGNIEPRLARRLRQLMTGGNRYAAMAVHASDDAISLIIRETYRHPALRNIVSFPAAMRTATATPTAPASDELAIAENGAEYRAGTPESDANEPADFAPDDDSDNDNEAAAVAVLADDIDDDPDADSDTDPGAADDDADSIPVLDTDDAETQPLPAFVRTDDPDWE